MNKKKKWFLSLRNLIPYERILGKSSIYLLSAINMVTSHCLQSEITRIILGVDTFLTPVLWNQSPTLSPSGCGESL
jgi:hypothetical protein